MERIEFFGSALLIPCFLVSIGTVIDPAVLIDPGTLGLAGVFVLACIGGKALAAVLCKPLFHYTSAEVGVVFGLSVAQAAATLAATFVGLEIGLFTTSTVNAVMIVIVVSLILASVFATRSGAKMPKPEMDTTRFGRVVLANVGVHRGRPGRARGRRRDRRRRCRHRATDLRHRRRWRPAAQRPRRRRSTARSSPSPSMPSSRCATTARSPTGCCTTPAPTRRR